MVVWHPGYKAGPAVKKALDPVLVFIQGTKIYLRMWSIDHAYGAFEPSKKVSKKCRVDLVFNVSESYIPI